jgi:hypothetical protein
MARYLLDTNHLGAALDDRSLIQERLVKARRRGDRLARACLYSASWRLVFNSAPTTISRPSPTYLSRTGWNDRQPFALTTNEPDTTEKTVRGPTRASDRLQGPNLGADLQARLRLPRQDHHRGEGCHKARRRTPSPGIQLPPGHWHAAWHSRQLQFLTQKSNLNVLYYNIIDFFRVFRPFRGLNSSIRINHEKDEMHERIKT